MTHHSDEEQRFLDNVRQTLDTVADSIDGQTMSKLSQARHKALGAKAKPGERWPGWQAGAILATAALLLLLVPQYGERTTLTVSKAAPVENMEIITDSKGLEFYRDLEFYYWLSTENGHAG